MKRPRIYSTRLYIVGLPQGISGFRQPDVPGIVTGARKRRDLLHDWIGRLPTTDSATFQLNDGRASEYRELGNIERVEAFLIAHPWAEVKYVL